jgi:methyltransferase family protein
MTSREEPRERNRAALDPEAELLEAQLALARRRLPGPDYVAWLGWLHRVLEPESYLEIGVARGRTLALARPPTLAIGVDPSLGLGPIALPLTPETHLFAQTSDDFFAKGRLRPLLQDRALRLTFVDGLHTFEQALRDFVNVEACSGPRSMVVFHDTVPLDEATQLRERRSRFWTGDVWKAVVCLRRYRPELEILTIAAPPTGLTIVTGLDPSSRVLPAALDESVERFVPESFARVEAHLESALSMVPNDRELVQARLAAFGIIDLQRAKAAS